jgi:hypothetical protein
MLRLFAGLALHGRSGRQAVKIQIGDPGVKGGGFDAEASRRIMRLAVAVNDNGAFAAASEPVTITSKAT